MKQEYPMEENIGFFIIDYSTGGGVERVTANLMHQFLGQGFTNLHLISYKQDLPQPAMDYPPLKSLKVLNTKTFAQELSAYLQSCNIKHLIFQGDNMTIALEVLKAAKQAQCKAYPQYHGSPYAYLKKYPDAEKSNIEKILFSKIVYPFKKNKLKTFIKTSPQGIFCVSQGSADELSEVFNKDKEITKKLKVIRNPIVLKKQSDVDKEKTIVLASRLETKHKNAFLAVKAWAIIANDFPDWTLKILGEGSLKNKMMQFCKTKNIRNVEFLGFVKDVDSELAKSSVSICVSNCEGFNMSVAEAIVQKNAMVSTDSDGGAKDMLVDNKTALISPKNDAEALAKNLSKIIKNKELRNELAENANHKLMKMQQENPTEMWLKELFS